MSTIKGAVAGGEGADKAEHGGHHHHHQETEVCNVSDLEVGKLKEVNLSDDRQCVLVKEADGKIRAVSAKCTHYGAPLAKGSYADGKIRCPWHGACFDAATGDIEDFPGLDSLHSFHVAVGKEGQVKVRAPKVAVANRRSKTLSKRDRSNKNVVVIVGGGAAGQVIINLVKLSAVVTA